MNLEIIEKRFCSYLDKFWKLNDVVPFLLVYIRLLVLFKSELSQQELNVTLERQKQLHGEKFNDEGFDQLKSSIRRKMDGDIASNSISTRKAMLNRLLFCALLNAEESDFFYLTEPMFEFAKGMKVTPEQMQEILESEFGEFIADRDY